MKITVQEFQLMFKPNIRMEKKCDLNDFNHCIVVGARWKGLSFSETLEFSYIAVSRVYV